MQVFDNQSALGRFVLGPALALGLAALVLVTGCGRTPPEPFWEPTAADSAAIRAIVEARRNLFTTGMAELATGWISPELPGTTAVLLREELISNPFKQRFRADSMEHIFASLPYRISFIATVIDSFMLDSARAGGGRDTYYLADTTATVTIVETIPGRVRFHAYAMTKFLRDTGITKITDFATGYAVGAAGRVIKTTDSGATWQQISTPTNADLNSVCFPLDYLYGYAAGSGGTIIRTTDAGITWQTAATGTSENLNAIFFPFARHKGFAVGDNGTILRSVDFGATWSPRPSGTTERLRSVAFLANARTGIAVGDNGTALRSVDTANVIWTARPTGTTEHLYGVTLLGDNTTAYAVGANGTIIKSTNTGSDWTTLTSGTTNHLRAVTFPTLAIGYVVGDNGTILKTTNSGTSWFTQVSNTTSHLRAVRFPKNQKRGWAFGADGTVVVTTSGGDTWQPVAVGGSITSAWFGAKRETLVVLRYYDSVFTHTDSFNPPLPPERHYIEKPFVAVTTSGCVLKRENGTWQFWKISGGSRFYAPNPADAPYILHVYLSGSQGVDTIFLRPGAGQFGIQRFYELDELPTFRTGDSLRISGTYTNVGDAANYIYLVRDSLDPRSGQITRQFYRRIEFDRGRNIIRFDSLIPPGLYRLYIEHVPVATFWEVDGRYTGTIWGVPLLVK